MHKPYNLLLALFIFNSLLLNAQKIQFEGGGEHHFEHTKCLNDETRAIIIEKLKDNYAALKKQGVIQENINRSTPQYRFPLKVKDGRNETSLWAVSNYVDHKSQYTSNSNDESSVLDYNCGTRSYDIDGYNHQGTDIFLWPFQWVLMNNDDVEIVAAEAGTILYKHDGEDDQNCSFCTGQCEWNAVYVTHTDGSVGWYGHMKKNSLTTKDIGETVEKGEYLGVVGSSGNSTGAHLHFEVYTDNSYDNLIDPYEGTCNALNSSSWWEEQEAYRQSTINQLGVHYAAPSFNDCPTPTTTNLSDVYEGGDDIYFAAYFRDLEVGDYVAFEITNPNGQEYTSWDFTSSDEYSAAYWYWSLTTNPFMTAGKYQFKATYEGNVTVQNFWVDAEPTSSIQEDKLASISLSPNPATQQLQLVGLNQKGNYSIINLVGKTVKEGIINENEQSIQISDLVKGVYFMNIEIDNQKVQRKFIKN